MTADLHLLAGSVALTWVMVMVAGVLRTRDWTAEGLKNALGNRADLPEPSAMAGRAERAARNMLENLPLFIGLIVVARLGGGDHDRIVLGAHVFFWARLAYFPVYLAGIPVLRTALWAAGVLGMVIVFAATL